MHWDRNAETVLGDWGEGVGVDGSNPRRRYPPHEIVVLTKGGGRLLVRASQTTQLLLSSEPIDEPVVPSGR